MTYLCRDLFLFYMLFCIRNYHTHIIHIRLSVSLHHSDNHDDIFYTLSLENNFLQRLLIGFTTHLLIHFLIIFFLLYLIKELVSIFCTPSSTIFYIPFRCLHFPIRNIIFHCERRYVPYTSIVWLCCKIAIV